MSITHLSKLLVDLKVIGRIEANGRISTTGRNAITLEQEGIFQSLSRKLWGDSRERAVEAITQVISGVVGISEQLLETPNLLDNDGDAYKKQSREKVLLTLGNTSKDLHAAVNGISNLSRTYADDAVMTAKLEQLLSDIEVHVKKIDQLLCLARTEPKPQLKKV